MHDIRWIRDNSDAFAERLMARGIPQADVDETLRHLLKTDEARRGVISELQLLQERRNAASKEVGKAKAARDESRAAGLIEEVASLKAGLASGEEKQRALDIALEAALAEIPNLPGMDVPVGADEHDNVEFSRCGEQPSLGFTPRQHFDLGEGAGGMDFETASRLSGARFVVLKGGIARLERALGQFMLDLHTEEHGYVEVQPPLLVRDEVMFGTAQLPKFRDDQFRAGSLAEGGSEAGDVIQDGRWLIPTAEVPLTNLVRESILSEEELPLRFTALTPCFRAEAGAAGRDTRGLIRQHQFNKVELVSITTPEQSSDEHARMLSAAEDVLKALELHYRVMTLCTGDMGFSSQKTWDIEVWLPGQGTFREISSCSVCGDFQARRMNARYRPAGDKGTRFVHTLNGSGVAVGRALVAVLENYQNEDGSITVPAVLRPYMRGVERIEPAA
ncbi:serine--tRNA ligase [Terrihabitans rhizophilus]|uniref:Serine--tRNA ligase n=1 Tax=Terrihabitans rhizophilus TaxID=3092662 RepID=A0ABU4RRX1_9HYPH|nr:serine--tRNA ligase [Terrihabitans sp. PJ23]MDX6807607.1 serine--tRNA ligase [Terrihabitans sp. PJ23]